MSHLVVTGPTIVTCVCVASRMCSYPYMYLLYPFCTLVGDLFLLNNIGFCLSRILQFLLERSFSVKYLLKQNRFLLEQIAHDAVRRLKARVI
jgi:hypothetical protein